MQDVRDAPLGERRALLDPEAMLLVDDRDGEIGELDLALDQRVGADGDLRLAARDPGARGRMLLRGQRAREQDERDAELRADALDRQEVLLGEGLRRRHQGALPAGFDSAQERVERDDRLPGADVALQQPRHRRRAGKVGVDLGDRLLLMLRQLEGKRGAVARDEVAGRRERGRHGRLAFGRPTCKRELEDEQLVEGEPPPPFLGLLERARPVQRDERVAAQRQAALGLQGSRERIRAIVGERQRRLDEVAELRRRDLLARGVDRCEVGRRRAPVQVVRTDREPVAVRRAAQPHPRAGRQLVLEPWLVEPRRRDLARPVGDLRREDLQAPAAAADRRAHDLALDQHLLLAEELRDHPLRRRPLVAARTVVEEVADPLEAELREPLLQRRPDPGKCLERRLEPLGPEAAARRRPLGQAGPRRQNRAATGSSSEYRSRSGR